MGEISVRTLAKAISTKDENFLDTAVLDERDGVVISDSETEDLGTSRETNRHGNLLMS